jgi:hypothetical protein
MHRTAVQLTVVTLGAVLSARPPAPVCTPVPLPVGRSAGEVFFIGAASSDTMLAGAGHESWGTGRGHSGFGRARTIYGQLVAIEQLQGVSRTMLPADTKSVLVVPWDYGADCSTVVWGRSAQWVTPGTRAVFRGRLRVRDDWPNGVPTIDVDFPEFSLYPYDLRRLYMLRDTALNDLSLENVLDLYERVPFDTTLAMSPDSAIQPLEAWARNNPELARRQPARTVLDFIRVDVEERRVSMIKSPIAGTYRFVVSVPGVDSLVLYLRTDDRPWGTQRGRYEFGTPEDSATRGQLYGYYLLTAAATSPGRLPRQANSKRAHPTTNIGLTPIVETSDSSVWRGGEDVYFADQGQEFWRRVIRQHYAAIAQSRGKDWYICPGSGRCIATVECAIATSSSRTGPSF